MAQVSVAFHADRHHHPTTSPKKRQQQQCDVCLDSCIQYAQCSLLCDVHVCTECYRCLFASNNEDDHRCINVKILCTGIYLSSTISACISNVSKQRKKEQNFSDNLQFNRIKNHIFVCNCDIGGFQVSASEAQQAFVTCPACRKQLCSLCGLTHKETSYLSTCPQMMMSVNNSKSIKPCPNCGIVIQKNDGCLHMFCNKCKHHFCWQCGKLISKKENV